MPLLGKSLREWLKYILPTLILGLTGYLLTLIPDPFYKYLGSTIGDKALLILCMLLVLLSCYFLLLANRSATKQPQEHPTLKPSDVVAQTRGYVATEQGIKEMQEGLFGGLGSDERKLLKRFIDEDTRTLVLGIFDPTARGLVKEGILIFVGEYPDFKGMYRIEDGAWEFLHKHPQYLTGTKSKESQ